MGRVNVPEKGARIDSPRRCFEVEEMPEPPFYRKIVWKIITISINYVLVLVLI